MSHCGWAFRPRWRALFLYMVSQEKPGTSSGLGSGAEAWAGAWAPALAEDPEAHTWLCLDLALPSPLPLPELPWLPESFACSVVAWAGRSGPLSCFNFFSSMSLA